MAAFFPAAAEAARSWQYEPPVEAPLAFAVTLRFRPGLDTVVAQEDYGATIKAGSRSPRVMDTLVVGRTGAPARIDGGLFGKTKHLEPAYPGGTRSRTSPARPDATPTSSRASSRGCTR